MIEASRVHSPKKHHATEKPLDLLAEIIRVATPQGGAVLDPFTGSGSVLVAAKQLGRQAIGVELSEAYCSIAADRLSQTSLFARAV